MKIGADEVLQSSVIAMNRDRRSWKTGLAHDTGGFVGEVTGSENSE